MTDRELLEKMFETVVSLKSDVAELKGQLQENTRKITDIQLTLENETNRNISIIAEGHLDIVRRFDEITKIESQKEMMHVRINVLENEVRRLKEKVEAMSIA